MIAKSLSFDVSAFDEIVVYNDSSRLMMSVNKISYTRGVLDRMVPREPDLESTGSFW